MRWSAIICLVLGLLSGLLTLLILVGGGYALWHTHGEVRFYEKQLEDEKKKADQILKDPKKTPDETKWLREFGVREATNVDKANEAGRYRTYAVVGVVTFIIPALMTVAFMTMFLASWLKSRAAARKAAANAAEEEDEEAEEAPDEKSKPTANKKTRDDDN
jgi:hypothetical protein